MTAPATPAPSARPAATHPCARCGAPVALDVGLCDRCNPLGLKDSASSQVHGTVIVAVGMAIVVLAIAAHVAVAGIGPFVATVTTVRASSGGAAAVVATISVRNDGTAAGTATCRISDPADRGISTSDLVYTAMIGPGATIEFDHEVAFGSAGQRLDVACSGP
ncbi:MAG TPA: hypothetical protein VFY18_10950 [Candidatus Limnocylindrales bacterium]|nr:hypothetical protein [Candidatus Limnocylindrales bacterium]